VNWVGNVLLPLYGVGQVVLAVAHYAGLLERMTIGEAWLEISSRPFVVFVSREFCVWGILDSARDSGRPVLEECNAIAGNTSESKPTNAGDLYVSRIRDLFIVLGQPP